MEVNMKMGRTAKKTYGASPNAAPRVYIQMDEYVGKKKTYGTHVTVYAAYAEVVAVIEAALLEKFGKTHPAKAADHQR